MLETTKAAMAMACWPDDGGEGAGGGRMHRWVGQSGGEPCLSPTASRSGLALLPDCPVAGRVRQDNAADLRKLTMPFVDRSMGFSESRQSCFDDPFARGPGGCGPGYDCRTTLCRSITMGFVNENIPEADLRRIDFASVIHPLHFCPINTPTEWTIDRERDIALISLGGGSGENSMYPSFFLIYWQGHFTDVHLVATTTGNFTTWDLEVTWSLRFLRQLDGVPEALFLETLKQALTCYGYMDGMLRDRVKNVKFNFDTKNIIRG
jgi:hypothetical protein